MNLDLEHLNKAQREAVVTTDGPLMILAGAGSGKTRTLVAKIAYLIHEKKVSPYRILAVTFSNKAAKEMRERVSNEIKIDIGPLQITTFHSFCAQVLRSEAKYIGLSRNFTIYDDGESKAIVKKMLSKRGISTKELPPNVILGFISEIKNNGFYPGKDVVEGYEIDKEDPFYEYYMEYESQLHQSNALDFGGLITGVIQLFETHPEVLERYQDRFHYVLVDEYQDTNRAQFQLINLLSSKRRNICVVGDEDQSIYSWRGADIRNILDFEKVFSESQLIKLEQNYRSSKNIIEAAGYVISRNEERKGKDMWTSNPEGESIEIVESPNDKKEAEFIVEEIMELGKSKVAFKDISIFYRNNSQSRLIEDQLRKNGLPYRIVAGIKFYERKEIKDVIAYLRLIINPKDSLALSRIINIPARGVGATSLRKFETLAVDNQLSLWEIIVDIVENSENYKNLRLSSKVKSALGQFVDLLTECMVLAGNKEVPSVIYNKILHESGMLDFYKASKDYESLARIENLEELYNGIKQFEESTQDATLVSFLETITLDDSVNVKQELGGDISLMTVHGSKGLEFPYVFLMGVEENIFPSSRSLDESSMALEEERRLFYVAMTRAMKKLFITFAQARMLFGSLKFNGPSRFLDEIPNKYYQWKVYHTEKKVFDDDHISDGIDYSDEFSQETDYESTSVSKVISKNKKKNKPKFSTGTRVLHSLYGEGEILETEGFGTDEKVTIKFDGGGRKKFMVKFAPLVEI